MAGEGVPPEAADLVERGLLDEALASRESWRALAQSIAVERDEAQRAAEDVGRERDRLTGEILRLESLGAVRAVAEPLRVALRRMLEYAEQRCVPPLGVQSDARAVLAGRSESRSSMPGDEPAPAPPEDADREDLDRGEREREAQGRDVAARGSVARGAERFGAVKDRGVRARAHEEVGLVDVGRMAVELVSAALRNVAAFGDESLVDTVRAQERMLDRLSDRVISFERRVEQEAIELDAIRGLLARHDLEEQGRRRRR